MNDTPVLGDFHPSIIGDFYNHCKDFYAGTDDHKPQEIPERILFKSVHIQLPSGKRRHSYGKIHDFQWVNPLFLWQFSIAMLNYQRVNHHFVA